MCPSDNRINTQELLKILGKPDIKYNEFFKIGENSFVENNLIEFWSKQKAKCKFQNSDIINRADIGYTFFYDIINGKKKPSREKLIRIFLAMELTFDEAQQALKVYCYSELYARNKRDSMFIYAINHKLSVIQLCDLLEKNGEEELK